MHFLDTPEVLTHIKADFETYLAGNGPDAAMSYEEALRDIDRVATVRERRMSDVSSFVWLPQLPDAEAQEIYDRIEEAEKSLISPNLTASEYGDGTASYDNEVRIIEGSALNSSLITAEHATDPVRKKTGVREGADIGTGGLSTVVAEDTGSSALIMLGRQTGNASVDLKHPMKEAIGERANNLQRFVAVHGMGSGKILEVVDDTEIHAIIGLGSSPNELSYDFAQRIKRHVAGSYGLRVTLGEEHFLVFEGEPPLLQKDPEGQPLRTRFDARGAGSSVNFVSGLSKESDIDRVSLQVELTKLLRLMPRDRENRDHKSRVMGVYLGYLLSKDIIELPILR